MAIPRLDKISSAYCAVFMQAEAGPSILADKTSPLTLILDQYLRIPPLFKLPKTPFKPPIF